jgi:hypothetical protein
MWRLLQLCMCQERIEDAQVGMSQRGSLFRQVKKVPYQDIHQHMEVIGEEVFIGAWCSEYQIEKLKR